MMDPTLRAARARYSAEEPVRGDPGREEYAAVRRWLSRARDAVRWSREAGGAGEALWLAKACDALARAEEHRASARRWRAGRGQRERQRDCEVAVNDCSICGAPLADDDEAGTCSGCRGEDQDPEPRAFEARLREDVRARATIGAYYSAARHALSLMRIYHREPGTSGRRERDALAQVSRYRAAIRDLRTSLRASPGSARPVSPGLSKAGPPSSREGRKNRGRAAG